MAEKISLNRPNTSISLDYLVIGHLTADLTKNGARLGGTSAFSGLTAKALGLQAGLVTSHSDELDTSALQGLWTKNITSPHTTTFKNISDGVARTQFLYQTAKPIVANDIPLFNPTPHIIHLGPVADEVDPKILDRFPESLKCLTPQGWMRGTNSERKVIRRDWVNYIETLSRADVAVISHEDVKSNEEIIASMASSLPVFVVTENYKGARIYWHNDARFINAPEVKCLDDTGAGDIFSTAFFYRYYSTKDPWEAGRFAVLLASWSVTRKHLDSIPTQDEIKKAKLQLLSY